LGHNYRVEKTIGPLTTHFGLNFYMGNNPQATGYGVTLPGLRENVEDMTADSIKLAGKSAGRLLTAYEANRFWMRRAFSFWTDNPRKTFSLMFHKIHRLISRKDFDDIGIARILPREIPVLRAGFVNFGLIWILACIGFMCASPSRLKCTVFWMMGACIVCGMLITFVTARYRLPLVILLLPAAANAVAAFPYILKNRFPGLKLSRFLAGLAGIFISIYPHAMPDTEFTDDLNASIYLCRAGRFDEALIYAQRACERRKDSPEAWLALRNAYNLQNKCGPALQCYLEALKIQGDRTDLLFNTGLTLEKTGNKNEAAAYYRQVVELEPRHAKAWLGLAIIYRELGDEKSARQAIEKAVEITGRTHPQIVEYYNSPSAGY
jgi:tetratricopeptide (TPR) repeat protein